MPGGNQRETFQKLSTILLLTYALRNADCHSKNLALLYTSRTDARLAPAYDFFTTSVYEGYQNNPPGISFMARKTWLPGKNSGHLYYIHIWLFSTRTEGASVMLWQTPLLPFVK